MRSKRMRVSQTERMPGNASCTHAHSPPKVRSPADFGPHAMFACASSGRKARVRMRTSRLAPLTPSLCFRGEITPDVSAGGVCKCVFGVTDELLRSMFLFSGMQGNDFPKAVGVSLRIGATKRSGRKVRFLGATAKHVHEALLQTM